MNEPSIVSSSDIPAANRTGRHKIAYQGRPLAAPVPASTRKATSVAVSKPSPNSRPTPYICRGRADRAHQLAEDPDEEAALVQVTLERLLVEAAPPQIPEDLEDAEEHDDVDGGDEVEEDAGHAGADEVGDLVQAGRAVVRDRADERADAERQQQAEQRRRRCEWPRENQKPTRQRALAVGHQLARGVVDGADVVGVERVPGAERVGGEPDAGAERLRADAVVPGDHDREQACPSRRRAAPMTVAVMPPACAHSRGVSCPLMPRIRAGFTYPTLRRTMLLLQVVRNNVACAPVGKLHGRPFVQMQWQPHGVP